VDWGEKNKGGHSAKDEVSRTDTEQRISASGLRMPEVPLPVAKKRVAAEVLSEVQLESVGRYSPGDDGIEHDPEICEEYNCKLCKKMRSR
jgi:hypothetical protein